MKPPSRPMSALRAAAATVLTAGVVAAGSACGTSTPEAGAPATSPTASTPASTAGTTGTPAPGASETGDASPAADGAGPILLGKRQIVLRPVASFESILAVDAKGRLNLTDGEADTSLFVLVPTGGNKHQIRTAKAGQGGEPDCMGLRDNGNAPATVVATACDTRRAGQLFTIEKTAEKSQGRPTYTIVGEGKLYLRASDAQGLTAQRVGEGDAGEGLVFDFVDNGTAPAGPGE